MSLQEGGPQEPQQLAARIIQKSWRGYVYREVFRYFKELIGHCNQRDPQSILKAVNPRESCWMLLLGCSSDFDLEGSPFLPTSTTRSSPTGPSQMCVPAAQRTTPSQALRSLCPGRPTMAGLQCRRTGLDGTSVWRTTAGGCSVARYNRGRLQTHPVHQRMATLAGSSAHEVMDTTEERGDDEVEERELDELLAWTTTLSFEEYMQEWRRLACSHSSEPSKDLHS
ncbi:protein MFI isoform X2 [Xiphias gladius]|uniref:protein MFI isoform X2 n=1 Tax=Xiphias gladius TaxID=8245 RepID=UPI001A98B2FC|nr:protein MFI isoform X2 [Xiphias gladius]